MLLQLVRIESQVSESASTLKILHNLETEGSGVSKDETGTNLSVMSCGQNHTQHCNTSLGFLVIFDSDCTSFLVNGVNLLTCWLRFLGLR